MPTTFPWIHLGTPTTSGGATIYMDVNEAITNPDPENAAALVGQTFGTPGNPLYSKISLATMNNSAATNYFNQIQTGQTFTTTVNGTSQTLNYDALAVYNITITYADGTTAISTAIAVQSTTGELFWAPALSANAGHSAKPIVSVSFNSVNTASGSFVLDRPIAGWDDGYVEGTAGADSIVGGYIEQTINGTDKIDGGDGISSGGTGWNDDRIRAGAGNDTIDGGLGNDSIEAGDGNDLIRLSSAYGNDTIFGGNGTDTLSGGDLTTNSSVSFSNGAGVFNNGTNSTEYFGIEVITTGSGNDFISAELSTTIATVNSGAGDDAIVGSTVGDVLNGDAGNDTIDGRNGTDTINGGDGDDLILLTGTHAADTITGGSGTDTVSSAAIGTAASVTYANGSGSVVTAGGTATFNTIEAITTGGGDDVINAGSNTGAATFTTGVGSDTITGGAGAETIYAGDGADLVNSGAGNDQIFGGAGADTLNGGAGNDLINGGDDSDIVQLSGTNFGTDTIVGGEAGADLDTVDITGVTTGNITVTYTGAEAGGLTSSAGGSATFTQIERIVTGGGNDVISAASNTAASTYDTGTGNDTITGGSGWETVYGGAGNDVINGGAGRDSLFGGDGADTFLISVGHDWDTIVGGEGGTDLDTIDTTALTTGVQITFSNSPGESGFLYGDGGMGTSFSEIEAIITGAGNDSLYGGTNTAPLTFTSGAGNDTLVGGAGHDTLYAGADNDYIFGSGGNDLIYAGDGNDIVSMAGGHGNDTIFGGAGRDTLTGALMTENTTIAFTSGTGGTFSDGVGTATFSEMEHFVTGSGNDIINGVLVTGNFSYDTGLGNDVINSSSGNDTITSGGGDDSVVAGAGNDVVYGGAGIDQLFGGDGNDSVFGGDGEDTMLGGLGDDTMDGGADNDRLWGGDGNDSMFGDTGNDHLMGEGGNDILEGGVGDDSLWGGADNDQLFGGDGRDSLDGGAGVDTLTGGDGSDIFVADGTADLITDFGTGNTGGIEDGDNSNNDFVNLSGYYNLANLATWNAVPGNPQFGNPLAWMRADQADGILQQAGGLRIQNGGVAVVGSALTTDTTGVTCFARGTLIATYGGEVAVEDLRQGDLVLTRDEGYQQIRWIGCATLTPEDLRNRPKLRPIRIRIGALGDGMPAKDLVVSPQHRILVASVVAERMFQKREVLVAAKHLTALDGIDVAEDLDRVEYWHFLLDRHQVVVSNGASTESLFTGPEALKSVSAASRSEILAIFPELMNINHDALPESARLLVPGRRARNLAERISANGQMLAT